MRGVCPVADGREGSGYVVLVRRAIFKTKNGLPNKFEVPAKCLSSAAPVRHGSGVESAQKRERFIPAEGLLHAALALFFAE